MTTHDHRFPTPEQIARELSGQIRVPLYAKDGSNPALEAFLEERSRAADRNPLRSTVEWLCPRSLTVYDLDSRVCHAQGPHGDLAPATDPEVAEIIMDLRNGCYDDVRDGIAQYFDDSVQIPDDRVIAAWSSRDGVRLAQADLVMLGDDAEARHLAADITVCRDMAAAIELELLVDGYAADYLPGLHKVAAAARDAAEVMPLMIDIADDIRAVISGIVEQRAAPQEALREIISEIDAVRADAVGSLSRHRAELRRERKTRPF